MQTTQRKEDTTKTAIEVAVKLTVLAIVLFFSFLILKPFLGIVAWSIILAVALFPTVEKVAKASHLSKKKVVIALAVVLNFALIVPTYLVSDKAIDSIEKLKSVSQTKELQIPPPPKELKSLPVIGGKLYTIWNDSSLNTTKTLQTFSPQIKAALAKGIDILGDTLGMIFFSIFAIIIAAFLMLKADEYGEFYKKISVRLVGKKGEEWAVLTALTIRSVASGVIGVAVIQAILVFAGLLVIDAPFSILIALVVMFLTIIQIPANLIVLPVVGYMLSQDNSTFNIVVSVYLVIAGAIDGVLKPMLMGRGVDIPMLVVLIGAIGGMLLMGMIGLFVGAVVFALTYKLFLVWLSEKEELLEEIQQLEQ